MDKELFRKLTSSIEEAIEIKHGRKKLSRITKYAPVNVKEIRSSLHYSQSKFATIMGVSSKTLQNWEQGRREPTGPARTLLKVVQKNPNAVMKALRG
jgi:putative transcriptional regulator